MFPNLRSEALAKSFRPICSAQLDREGAFRHSKRLTFEWMPSTRLSEVPRNRIMRTRIVCSNEGLAGKLHKVNFLNWHGRKGSVSREAGGMRGDELHYGLPKAWSAFVSQLGFLPCLCCLMQQLTP